MAPKVLDVYNAEDPRSVIQVAVETLQADEVVAFPTETVYGLGAAINDAAAIEKIFEIKGRPESQVLTLAINDSSELIKFAPNATPLAKRLARRCWPGPLTMVVDATDEQSLVRSLPDDVIPFIAPEGWVGLRVPSNEVLLTVLEILEQPIALTSANKSGEADATTAHEVADQLGDELSLVVDGGPTKIGTPSTVIRLANDEITVLRSGAIDNQMLRQLAQPEIVIICTGNTCRSPMAELLLKKKLADKLECDLTQLKIRVQSAGIAASQGSPAALQAVQVLDEQGLDLNDHTSQQLNYQFARDADLLLTLSNSHRRAIIGEWPEFEDKTFVLDPDGGDVADPFGAPVEVYQACAQQIDALLEQRLPEILGLQPPHNLLGDN
jgi:protein-tyrosine phosphatase